MEEQPVAEVTGVKGDLPALERLFRRGIGIGIGSIRFEEGSYQGIDTEFERVWSVIVTGTYFSLPYGTVAAIQVGETLRLYFYPPGYSRDETTVQQLMEAIQKIKNELCKAGIIEWPDVLPAKQQTEDTRSMTKTANEMESTTATRQTEPRTRGKNMEQYFDDGAPGKEKLVKTFVYPASIGHFKAFMRRLEKVDLAGGWEATNGVVLAFYDTYSPANEKCGRWTVYPFLWKNNISAWATIEACEERPDATAVYCFDGHRAVSLDGDLHDRPKIGSIFLEFVNFLEREASAATKPAAHAGIPSLTWSNLSNTTSLATGSAETVSWSEEPAATESSELINYSKRGMTKVRQKRAQLFRQLKDAHPDWSYAKVALEANHRYGEMILGRMVTEHDVRNDYRAMGWKWKRADRVRR